MGRTRSERLEEEKQKKKLDAEKAAAKAVKAAAKRKRIEEQKKVLNYPLAPHVKRMAPVHYIVGHMLPNDIVNQ